jgi:hypothetical protein
LKEEKMYLIYITLYKAKQSLNKSF